MTHPTSQTGIFLELVLEQGGGDAEAVDVRLATLQQFDPNDKDHYPEDPSEWAVSAVEKALHETLPDKKASQNLKSAVMFNSQGLALRVLELMTEDNATLTAVVGDLDLSTETLVSRHIYGNPLPDKLGIGKSFKANLIMKEHQNR